MSNQSSYNSTNDTNISKLQSLIQDDIDRSRKLSDTLVSVGTDTLDSIIANINSSLSDQSSYNFTNDTNISNLQSVNDTQDSSISDIQSSITTLKNYDTTNDGHITSMNTSQSNLSSSKQL